MLLNHKTDVFQATVALFWPVNAIYA